MTVRSALVIVSLFVPTSASIASAEGQPAATANAVNVGIGSPTLFPQDAGKSPYGKLFVGSTAGAQQRPTAQAREPRTEQLRPKVVCGMLLIPADASIDPRFRVSPPSSDTTHTIRAVKPPMCGPEQ